MKRYLLFIAIIALLTNLFAGCSYIIKPEDLMSEQLQQEKKHEDQEKQVDPGPTYGGNLEIPMLDSPSLNPLLLDTKSSHNIFGLIYDNLVDYDSEFKLQPALAQSWEFSADGKEASFMIKKGVKWHDGEELTAHDVKFTLDMILSDKIESPYKRQLSVFIKSYMVDGENTIKIVFNKSAGGMLGNLAIPIIPEHYYKSADYMIENQRLLPIGTGAYKVAEYNRRKDMVLQCNEGWWKQRPYIKNIRVKIVPDQKAELAALQAGLIDICCTDAVDADKYAQFSDTNIYQICTQNYEFIALNQNNIIFQDKSVREAIALGINKDRIIKDVLLDHGINVDVPVQPESWLYDESFDMYSYEPDKAKDVLSNAGWADQGGDGILSKTIDGKQVKLEFELLTNQDNEIRKSVAEMIADDLKNIGMNVNIEHFSWKQDESEEAGIQKITEDGKFDALLTGYNLSRVPDLSFAFHSDYIKEGQNFVSYSNEEIDHILDSLGQHTQEQSFRAAFVDMVQTIGNDLPYISLYFRTSSMIASQKVKDVDVHSEDDLYRELYKWYIFDQ